MESKRLNHIFANMWNKIWGTSLLQQVVLASSIKAIPSSISLKYVIFSVSCVNIYSTLFGLQYFGS